MHFTDKQLCQLIDGELSTAEESALRKAMADDDALAERFAQLAMLDVRYKSSVAAIDETLVPNEILSLLSENQPVTKEHYQTRPAQDSNSLWQQIIGVSTKLTRPAPAMAAAFSVLIIMAVVFSLRQPGEHPSQLTSHEVASSSVMATSHPVAEILSNTPSGSSQLLASSDDTVVTPLITFVSADGTFCREYTLRQSTSTNRAVACRADQGWQIVLSTLNDDSIDAQQYQTASGNTTPDIFDEQVNKIIQGDPLSSEQELRLIEKKWIAE